EGYKLSYAEYKVGDYERSFTLSDQIQKDKIEAKLQNGVLNLVLPKVDEVKTRKIEIKTAA
ncbi:MAG: Hsp20/alpha crystallin family protein, partial [Nitrospirae bacterium]|nr:Hsp20/alpha crystallin family protein [Nitrospirota bacterium]